MPRFYFDLTPRNGLIFIDDEGIEMPDIEAAKIEAWYALRDLLIDHFAGEIVPTTASVQVRSRGAPMLKFKAKIEFDI